MNTRSHAVRLSFVLLLAAGTAVATHAASAATVGAQLGVNRSGVDGDSPPNSQYSDKAGLVAGIQGEFGFARDLSLSVQPSFVQKNCNVLFAPSTPGGSTTELGLAFDCVSVPVLVKFVQGRGRTYVATGVTFDFLTSATLSGQGSGRDVMSAYSSAGLGAVLGFGLVFPAGRTHLTSELRYVQGISNMTPGTVAAAAGALAPRLHATGWQLVIGDLLPIGGRR